VHLAEVTAGVGAGLIGAGLAPVLAAWLRSAMWPFLVLHRRNEVREMVRRVLLSSLVAVQLQTLSITAAPTRQLDVPGAQAPSASSLSDLVTELEKNNPELQAAQREVDMRVARIAPAGALADPTLSASSMSGFSRPPFFGSSSTPNAFRMFNVAQEVPYPGKRALRTSVASADADAERFNYDGRRRALVADLKATYLEYALTTRSLEILVDSKTLLEQLRQISEARFSVGKGVQQDVVKAQLELSMLLERQTVLEQQRRAIVARLNALLFRSSDSPAPSHPMYAVASLPADLPVLRALVDTHYPALQRDARLIEKGQRALELSRKELRPDFRIGISAQRYTGDMPWMYGLDVMVSLPVYAARKQRPMIAEASDALAVANRFRDRDRAMAEAEVTQAYLAMAAANQLMTLYSDSVLPQSRLALESSLAAYQAGTVDFLSVLTNYQAVFAAQLSRVEQEIRRDQALARLEPYVGVEYVK
jgi:cobalt-zinc-cadmium efflux system outer membrane protein